MPEAPAQKRRTAHLPEQPRQALRALCRFGGQKCAEFFCQIHEDRAGFKHPHRLRTAAVQQGWNLGVGVGADEAAAELFALQDADQPGVVLSPRVAQGQQLLQHDGHFHAVGRAQRIELQRVLAARQIFVMRRPSDRPVDVGKAPPAGLVPGPNGGRNIRRWCCGVGHRAGRYQAKVKPSWLKGVLRARTPLAAAMALANAGTMGA